MSTQRSKVILFSTRSRDCDFDPSPGSGTYTSEEYHDKDSIDTYPSWVLVIVQLKSILDVEGIHLLCCESRRLLLLLFFLPIETFH